MTTITLTPQALSAMLRGGEVPDEAWRQTPIGLVVEDYLGRRSTRVADNTILSYRNVLSRLAAAFTDHELHELSGKAGRAKLEAFVNREYRLVTDQTRRTYLSAIKAFFRWCYAEELILRDPTVNMELPRRQERRYVLFDNDEFRKLVDKQPRLNDRVAILLVFEFALRANDLRMLQFSDFARPGFVMLGHGKGSTVRELPFRTEEARLAMERLLLERQPEPNEFLLYPEYQARYGTYPDYGFELRPKPGKDGTPGRMRPKSYSALNDWWRNCLERAGVGWKPLEHRMHDARHTTGTNLRRHLRETKKGDLDDLRRFMRHKSIQTTELYVHLDEAAELKDVFRD